jgi:hypothetical protein
MIAACGIAAPLGSLTIPVTEAVETCAPAVGAKTTNDEAKPKNSITAHCPRVIRFSFRGIVIDYLRTPECWAYMTPNLKSVNVLLNSVSCIKPLGLCQDFFFAFGRERGKPYGKSI